MKYHDQLFLYLKYNKITKKETNFLLSLQDKDLFVSKTDKDDRAGVFYKINSILFYPGKIKIKIKRK